MKGWNGLTQPLFSSLAREPCDSLVSKRQQTVSFISFPIPYLNPSIPSLPSPSPRPPRILSQPLDSLSAVRRPVFFFKCLKRCGLWTADAPGTREGDLRGSAGFHSLFFFWPSIYHISPAARETDPDRPATPTHITSCDASRGH